MTNRGLFFILICHLLAPLACQIREEGQQTNLAETPVLPPSTLQAKVETRSEGPDDYAIRLMWLPTIPVRITRSYIETKPDGRVFENSESFEVTDPTGEYFDAKVQAGLAYRYEVQPLDVASPRFSPESLEVKVPRDSVITMENLITNYGRETSTFAWTTARGFIPEKEKVWLSGGDYRLEFDQIRIGKDAEMILQSHVDPAVSRQFMDLRPEFLTNLTRNTSKGIWVSLFAKQAVGNLKIKFERGVESEQMGLMIDVADAELFKVTLVQSGTLKEDDLIVVRTGDQYQFLEKGVLSPLEPHLGIYEPIVPKEGEPDYILISYGGGKVHLHWDTFFGEQVLVEKRYRRIKTTSDLPEANYQKMTQERIAASPPGVFHASQVHDLTRALYRELIKYGIRVSLDFHTQPYEFDQAQVDLLKLILIKKLEFATALVSSGVSDLQITNHGHLDPILWEEEADKGDQLVIGSRMKKTSEENLNTIFKLLREGR